MESHIKSIHYGTRKQKETKNQVTEAHRNFAKGLNNMQDMFDHTLFFHV